jgi:hypothetical protein
VSAALVSLSLTLAAYGAEPEPARRALLVGINNYQWSGAGKHPGHPELDFPNLDGAAGDAIWFKAILTSKYGFKSEDVVVLTDKDATHQAIIDNFRQHLIDKSHTGDVALIYYAGHGSYRVNAQGEKETTIIPYDSRDPEGKVFDISSTPELHQLFVQLLGKTKNVTRIFDSCYSDSGERGGATRFVPPDNRTPPPDPTLSRGAVALNPITEVIRISASESGQKSQETTDHKHGLFSFALFNQLLTASDDTKWSDVMDEATKEVAKQNASQDPQLEPTGTNVKIFGGVGLAAKKPYWLITPKTLTVELNAGSLQGLAEGAVLDVYNEKEREFTGPPKATITVTEVADLTSKATVAAPVDPTDLKPGYRAVVRSMPPTAFRFLVHFAGTNPTLAAIQKAALADAITGFTLSPRKTAEAIVRIDKEEIIVEGQDGRRLSPSVRVDDADAVSKMVAKLTKWSRWHMMLETLGDEPVLKMRITETGKNIPVTRVTEGTRISVSLCNGGTQPYWAKVVDFSIDGMHPLGLDTDTQPLPPSDCTKPENFLNGQDFDATIPPDRATVTEIFRAFATRSKLDAEFFGWDPDQASDPANEASRGGPAKPPVNWSALTTSLTIRKK